MMWPDGEPVVAAPLVLGLDWARISLLVGGIIFAVDLALRVFALGFIPENRRPASGMAWLILILVAPVIGFLLFLALGRTSVGRERAGRQREANERIRQRVAARAPVTLAHDVPGYLPSTIRLSQTLGAFPAVGAHAVSFYDDYDASIAAMAQAVAEAAHTVHVEFYITAWDDTTEPLFRALVDATARGVSVRLLFDHLGSRGLAGYREMLAKLAETKIAWHPMLPLRPVRRNVRRPDLRNHRKILVVDGRVAFTGSQNLVEPGYHKEKNHRIGRRWVELTARVHGDLALSLDGVFLTDWYTETGETPADPPADAVEDAPAPPSLVGQVVPSGPGVVAENNLRLFTTLIYSAQRRISITSPYFVPDESLLYAVTTAAQRGVAVELFVGEVGDQFMVHHAQRSYYQALLEAGVGIFLYQAPLVLHSKHFSIDEDVVVLGSSNMDMRSFALNYEVSLLVCGASASKQMRRVEDHYRAHSRPLTLQEWGERSRRSRYVDNVMRLTAALQ